MGSVGDVVLEDGGHIFLMELAGGLWARARTRELTSGK